MPLKEQAGIVYWNTPEGKEPLFESKFHDDFFRLAHLFQPQARPTYCGVASATILLNAFRLGKVNVDSGLSLAKPVAYGGGEMQYNAYTQDGFFNAYTDKVKTRAQVEGAHDPNCPAGGGFNPGLSLDELARKMSLHHLDVEAVHIGDEDPEHVDALREALKEHLKDNDTFIIANFYGRALGKDVGGHFSPIVAYHRKSDSCLVMDVAGHKHPWFWVNIEALCKAMHTKDGESFRGYMMVTDRLSALLGS